MKKCVLFAGVVGCSKTPVANYLSYKLALPVFNNDAIRTEVIEDLGVYDEEEFRQRLRERAKEMVSSGIDFIADASIDREYKEVFPLLREAGFTIYIISFDLSRGFLLGLYKAKSYYESFTRLDELMAEHDSFLENNKELINLTINDANFKDRLQLAYAAVRAWYAE